MALLELDVDVGKSLVDPLAERDEAPTEVIELAERRVTARTARDFETSDRLRDELAEYGWAMRDEPDGGYTLVRRDT